MRVDFLDQMYYGNYKFTVELDTGSETGYHQLTVWAAEKINIDNVPLSKFTLEQLFRALIEPHKSRLQAQLEKEKTACREPFDEEIEQLKIPFKDAQGKDQRLPSDVKWQIRALQDQKQKAEKRLVKDFAQRELVTLDRQCFDKTVLQEENRLFEEGHFLRNFYFDEANERYIDNFCRKFALNPAYRQEVLSGRARWMKRNALFCRNILHVLGNESSHCNKETYDSSLRQFFKWIDKHIEDILALPEYQHLKEIDSAFDPNQNELDPLIWPAVELLNQIPGVTTRFSCQGVSGTVQFQGLDLLVVSPHEEYAYVSFATLEQSARDAIMALLPAFPGISAHLATPTVFHAPLLRSTGHNLRFREELVALARRVLDEVKAEKV